jgi:hypothetical protein
MEKNSSGLNLRVTSADQAKEEIDNKRRGPASRYEAVAQKWKEVAGSNHAVVVKGLEEEEIASIRSLIYDRFGSADVVVRSGHDESGSCFVVIMPRDGSRFLKSKS